MLSCFYPSLSQSKVVSIQTAVVQIPNHTFAPTQSKSADFLHPLNKP